MKKAVIVLISVLVIILVPMFAMSACSSDFLESCLGRIISGDGNGGENENGTHNNGLDAPSVISYHDYLEWASVEGAESYKIYQDGVAVFTCTETTYGLPELSVDTVYTVAACDENGESEQSQEVTVYKNSGFGSNELLDLSEYDSYDAEIPRNIRKIVINKNGETFNFNSIISERTADLIIELKDVTVYGNFSTEDGSYSREDHNYNVIFEIEGTCAISGNDGANGADYSGSSYDNSGKDAGRGVDGQTAIVAPTAIIKGNGMLTLSGGNGGDGGKGAGTTTWASASPGKGANGGNGGAGIKTDVLIVNMDSSSDVITMTCGTGGKKGNPGANGSLLTGPAASLVWEATYDIGRQGDDGVNIIGEKRIISGSIS